MRRRVAGGMLGMLMIGVLVGAPPAQAQTHANSTTCSLTARVKFRPGITQVEQRNVRMPFRFKLSHCAGGGVVSATGYGGGIGTVGCLSGQAVAKAHTDWDTGETSGLNLMFDIGDGAMSGKVIAGKFTGDPLSIEGVTVTPVRGDCVDSPLRRARLTATLGL
jgi:hypothetical protein